MVWIQNKFLGGIGRGSRAVTRPMLGLLVEVESDTVCKAFTMRDDLKDDGINCAGANLDCLQFQLRHFNI